MKVTDKIEGYENLSAEEKLKALEELEVDDNEQAKLKKLLNDASAEASKYKKELKAKEEELNSKLTEQERIEREREAKEAEKDAMLQKLLKEKSVAEQKANFLKQGYDEDLATTSATALVDGDFKTVFDNLSSFISNRDKAKEVESLDAMKRPATGSKAPEVTQEQFKGMSFKDRNKLFMENQELYETLSKGE